MSGSSAAPCPCGRVVLHASHLEVYDKNVEVARHERLIAKGSLDASASRGAGEGRLTAAGSDSTALRPAGEGRPRR
ncbi:hypothetical protein [Streptomyces sp900116325]|uniref:hypothetical protein n=1 Tax=Streptomyces sp. 900116325 TaxID=3154295 RepID=UPI0033B22191